MLRSVIIMLNAFMYMELMVSKIFSVYNISFKSLTTIKKEILFFTS